MHGIADQEQRGRRAVVGAAARVFFRPPAELGPGRDQYLVRHVVRGQVLIEGRDRRVQVAHQVVVAVELCVMRVEAPERDMQQLDAGAGHDQLSR